MRELIKRLNKHRWIRLLLLWIGLPVVLFFVLLFLIDGIVMPAWTRHGNEFPAPGIVMLSSRAAQTVLEDIGSTMQIAEQRYSADNPGGTILEQRPLAGAPIKSGRVFSVVISRGSELINVPNVRGYTPRQAELILTQVGLLAGGRGGEVDDSLPTGTVVRTVPGTGNNLPRGAVVNLLVNERPDSRTAWCPNLVGLNIEEAREVLRKRSLLIGAIDRQYDKSLLPGTVVTQSHAPGEQLAAGTEIDLVISRDR